MTVKSNIVFLFFVNIELLVVVLRLLQLNPLHIASVLGFIAYLLIPGYCILAILKVKYVDFWRTIIFSSALSIACLEFGGLFLNMLLPSIGINNPLSLVPIVCGLTMCNLLLILAAWLRNKNFELTIHLPKFTRLEKIMFLVPQLFPMFTILGAIQLNNGGTNFFTMLLLGSIATYSVVLACIYKKIPPNIFPYTIFFIAISLLFTTSLRGWFITGHDIQREYYVFRLTETHERWIISAYKDAYNACLSITILPTVLTQLLGITDTYIYKVIFQIFFALSPVTIFFVIRKYTNAFLSFLSVFYFMSFPTFFNDMPMLNRQEIGFIFFGLVLYAILDTTNTLFVRKLFFIIFSITVVVSHYSTNYILLAICLGTYVLSFLFSRTFFRKISISLLRKSPVAIVNEFTVIPFITIGMLGIIFLFTFFWNTQFTHTSNNVQSVLTRVIRSFTLSSQNETKSVDASYSIFSPHKSNPTKDLHEYIAKVKQTVQQNASANFYPQIQYAPYTTHLLNQGVLPFTVLGSMLRKIGIPINTLQSLARSLSSAFIQIAVFVGVIGLLLYRDKKKYDMQYVFAAVIFLMLLIIITILPSISLEYGILRLFQQSLFVLGYPIIITLSMIFAWFHSERAYAYISIVSILFFLTLTGFFSEITGGYYPQITLDNTGLYYDAYYTSASDIAAGAWLKNNMQKYAYVQADLAGTSKLINTAGISALTEIFPETTLVDAYVYVTKSTQSSNGVVSISQSNMVYSSPKPFLDNNKNLVYSNGKVNIYK